MAETQTAPPTKKTKGTGNTGVATPRRFLFFRQKSADRLAIERLLSQAIANRNGGAGSLVGNAVTAFTRLGDDEMALELRTVNSRLRGSSKGLNKARAAAKWGFVGDVTARQKAFGDSVHATTVLASFIKTAAACLPRQDGELVMAKAPAKANQKLQDTLARITQKALSVRSHDGSNVQAALASADALWGLDYTDKEFWTGLIDNPATRAQTITKFLEMEGDRSISSHGWRNLQENMADLWLDIARNPSPLTAEFLVSTAGGQNDCAAIYAFRAAAYLTAIPSELIGIAQRMQLNPAAPVHETGSKDQAVLTMQAPEPITCHPDVRQAAFDFLFVVEARELVTQGGGSAFAGVFSLAMLYSAGERAWLRPMLDAICAGAEAQARTNGPETAEHRHALLILGALGIAGVKAQQGVSASGGIFLPAELGRIAWDLLDGLPRLNIKQETGGYAEDGYSAVRSAALRVFDSLRLGKLPVPLSMDEAALLVPDLITVRNHYNEKSYMRQVFDSALADLGAGLVDTVVSPPGSDEKARAAARQAAHGIITAITDAGIAVPHSDFLDASIAFTLHSASQIPQEVVAQSISAGPLNCAFTAGIYLPAIPAELLAFAATVHGSAQDPVTKTFAKDFMFMNEAKCLLTQEGHRRFAGALGAALLYKAGKSELASFMNGMIRTSLQADAAGKEQPDGAAGKKKADATTNAGGAGKEDKAHKEDREQSADGPSAAAKARAETAHSILVAFHVLGVMEGDDIKVPQPSFVIPKKLLTASLDAPLAECVLVAGTYLDPAPAELKAFAEDIYRSAGGEEMKTLAWDFLLINEALARINRGDKTQFDGVQTLVELYARGRKGLGLLLQYAGQEMADVIMKPPAGEGQESQSALAWAAINAIEKAGIDLTYHKLHAASYLSAVPDEITNLAEGILAQPEPEESLAAAARDLLAIREVKALLARDGGNERVCAYALANLAATGTGNLKDMLEAIGARQVLVVVNGDNQTRHKAMRLLASLQNLDVPGAALFAAGLNGEPGSIEPALLSAAVTISAGRYPNQVRLAAQDLITLNTARLDLADPEKQFDGACALADLYVVGRLEAGELLDRDAGPRMVEAFKSAQEGEAQDAPAKAIARIHAARPEAITGLPTEQLDAILNRGKADGDPAQVADDSQISEAGDSNE